MKLLDNESLKCRHKSPLKAPTFVQVAYTNQPPSEVTCAVRNSTRKELLNECLTAVFTSRLSGALLCTTQFGTKPTSIRVFGILSIWHRRTL
jgi:hypothetical protein